MDAPKCRLCGEKHYAYQPHTFPKSSKEAKASDILEEMRSRSATNKRILGAIRGNEKQRGRVASTKKRK